MLDDASRKRRETTAATLGLHADAAWNTASYYHAIRTKIGHELRAGYDLRPEIPHQILPPSNATKRWQRKSNTVVRLVRHFRFTRPALRAAGLYLASARAFSVHGQPR
jgi:hypothetical protein